MPSANTIAGLVIVPKERTGGLASSGCDSPPSLRSAVIMPSVTSISTMLATANGMRGSISRKRDGQIRAHRAGNASAEQRES